MRAVIDTCAIADALQSRESFCKDGQSIFLLCADRQSEGLLTAKAITDIIKAVKNVLDGHSAQLSVQMGSLSGLQYRPCAIDTALCSTSIPLCAF